MISCRRQAPPAARSAETFAGVRARGLAVPTALFLTGLVIMIVGGRHFGNGWPGTGGHPWARTGLVPGGVAAFFWACTLSVSSFWAHPGALAAFPAAELTWMALSPLALACLVAGAATTVRRAELSPAILRFEGRLGVAACVTMAAFLGGGCAWLAGVGGAELVSRSVLPGRYLLDRLDGACSVPAPPLAFAPPGPAANGTFYSAARRRTVGYTIAYPPARRPGDDLPLVVMLHAYGGNHADALAGMSPAQAVALKPGGRPLAPMAMVTVDGGDGYWNPHPGDDPMAMVIDELIPRCQRLGLGRPPRRIAVMGTSMGGFGALLLAERYPRLFAAVAAVSPAVWTSYPQARRANPGAFASAAAFAGSDVIAHAAALGRRPLRIASAYGDPFYPDVRMLARALPAGAVAVFGPGCHDGSFFAAQEPPSLAFLASHLA